MTASESGSSEDVDSSIKAQLEDEVIREALTSGMDLRQYSQSVEKELRQNMQGMLEGFLTHLSTISQEIQSLQEQSASINVQLTNRKQVHVEMSTFIDQLMVPEIMIQHILNTPVTDNLFMQQLKALNQKSKFIKEQNFRDAHSCQDVQDIVDKLTVKAVTKIREYLLQKIYQFRKPLSNYQIPQNAMIKHKFFFEFLLLHARTVAAEIHDEYVETMSRVYSSYFQSYTKQLWKLQYEEGVTRDDLMGVEDSRANSFFTKSLKSRGTVFTLGTRDSVLSPTGLIQDIIVPHTAGKGETKYAFEVLFRSQQYALMDNGCREYIFLTEFFMVHDADAMKLYMTVMGKTLQHVQKEVCGVVMGCYDSIALYLCVHLIHQYRLLCHKRAVPALDNHWEQLLHMIWPRFEYVVKMNIQSIQACDPSKMAALDMRPHYITRRYAEFSGAVMVLHEKFPLEGVDGLMLQLQDEVEKVILKMAAVFHNRKDQLIFLINNYDMMLSVLSEKTREDSRECERLKELLGQRTGEYIEEVLAPHFGGMLTFVRETDHLIANNNTEALKDYEKKVVPLVRSFSSTWKKSVERLNNEVMQCFTNFRTGTVVLQRALETLITAHHTFNRTLAHAAFHHLNIKADIVNSHHLIVEAKKYKPTF
ncbi:vacuolar protein sorting-associated protein 52 homolog isoform X2 [Portunus trituberculatus]|uniref:vacuolar protein sorting-associated protein 52 homolog isoform X2 n=1 Tax=Portunus trituberculatus TaxID=210409 RepID=UPI001E1CE904|nr:vacuolar protein sorting-associated protein 52 homolog isoform X2 [Portunus trituberculatus]